jgi:hypothetical protein
MKMDQYINSESIQSTIQTIFNQVGQLSRTEIVGVAAITLATYYAMDTFVFDHLRNIPGPFGAKLSRFYEIKNKASGKEYLLVAALHDEYGDVVRKGSLIVFAVGRVV